MSGLVALLCPAYADWERYQSWLAKAWQDAGGEIVPRMPMNRWIRIVLGRFPFPLFWRRAKVLLVCTGRRADASIFPYFFSRQIVPIMWDLWPEFYAPFARCIRMRKIRLCFCTSSQGVERMRQLCPRTKFVWMPEGLDVASYPAGGALNERVVDLFSFGRIAKIYDARLRNYEYHRSLVINGDGGKSFDELTHNLRAAKITICYPQCDTAPEKAGDVETLTQRYWECMASGTLVAGRAPKELIDVCGYNPVIELGENICEQLDEILAHIEDWQELADKNRRTVESVGDWKFRIPILQKGIEEVYGLG